MKLEKKKDPLPCSSGYSIDAYCQYNNPKHKYEEDKATFFGSSERDARADARAHGWIITKDWMSTCPLCAKMLKNANRLARLKDRLNDLGLKFYDKEDGPTGKQIEILDDLRKRIKNLENPS